jgi:60 kDa SS-A/Ro ribonucleoprotein
MNASSTITEINAMANQQLFRPGRIARALARVPQADARNAHGAPAYAREPRLALAQFAATGCLANTFYSSAANEMTQLRELCQQLEHEPEFIAKTAIYCRERAFMKDVPAFLLAVLTARRPDLLERVFDRVIDSPKMLRNYVQIVRSGAAGRRSFGTLPRRLIRQWLEARSDEALVRASVGQAPSLADIVKMVHPKPQTAARRALYGWLIGRPYEIDALPATARAFEDYKAGRTTELAEVPFEMLTALPLTASEWRTIASRASWHQTRMSLNLFARHGVFGERDSAWDRFMARIRPADSSERSAVIQQIAARLRDRREIQRARVFPYQLMVAHANADDRVPAAVREALVDAVEIALENVPSFDQDSQVYVCLDVSGSMHSPVTGARHGSATAVQCVQVAALMAAAIVRRNPSARVLPFHDRVVSIRLDPYEPVLTLARRLSTIDSGGTNCSAPLAQLNRERAKGAIVIYLSDNESWVDARVSANGTAMLEQWELFKQRNPHARLVCIDLQPSKTTQAMEREDVLNVGGFSDQVFEVVAEFAAGRLHPAHWVALIDAVTL